MGTPLHFTTRMGGRELLGIIFRACRELQVSDIQMRSGRPVYIHTNNGMDKLDQLGLISARQLEQILEELIAHREQSSHGFGRHPGQQRTAETLRQALVDFAESRVIDFSCDGMPMGERREHSGRLRIQAHLSVTGLGITCRILSDHIPALEALGIDPDTATCLRQAVTRPSGLCLVTGAAGSGKSTTLASLIDWLRRHHAKHIVTIEDPVEYKYPEDMEDPEFPGHRIPSPGIVTQQEVGRDVVSYRQGLKDVLRKTPHVILLGEIRDREAMEMCMEAARNGHLVISTLPATGVAKTIGRILELYPQENQSSVLRRLSEVLIGIHSQGLLNGINQRVLNYEFLHGPDHPVSGAITNDDRGANSLVDVIKRSGNPAWDDNLHRLFNEGLISFETYEASRMNRHGVTAV